MKKFLGILQKCSIFQGIKEEDLSGLLGCLGAKIETYDKRATVIEEGEEATRVGILLSGGAQIIRIDYYGNRSIVSEISPSEIFGETFACANIKAVPVSVVTTEKSEIMFIDCFRLTRTCSNACDFHNRIIYNLMRSMAVKNLIINRKIEITSKRTTREKLMAYLLMQAKEKGRSFTIPYDRQELADYLEVDRSGLSAEISKLRREGVIKSEKNRFEVL